MKIMKNVRCWSAQGHGAPSDRQLELPAVSTAATSRPQAACFAAEDGAR